MNNRSGNINFIEMPLDKLGIYVMDIQHPYLKKALATFLLCSSKIVESNEQEAVTLADALTKLGTLIEQHLTWEEQIFFPYLRLMIERRQPQTSQHLPTLFSKIKSDHYSITKLITRNRLISNHYVPAAEASPAIKLCYAQLFDFEQDILKHIFLEEDLLFPKLFNQKTF